MTLPKTSDEHSKLHLIYIEYRSERDASVQRALRKATSHQPSNLAISLCFGHFSSFSLGTYGWPYHTLPQSARTANSEAKDGQKMFTSPLQTVHLSKVAWLKPFGRRIQTQVKIIKKRTLTDMSKDFCEQMQAHVKNAHDSSLHHLYVAHVSHYKRQKTHIEVVSTTGMTNLSTQHCDSLKTAGDSRFSALIFKWYLCAWRRHSVRCDPSWYQGLATTGDGPSCLLKDLGIQKFMPMK